MGHYSYGDEPKCDDKGREIRTVYALEPGEEVGCYFCMCSGNYESRQRTYKRGEAFLCGPEHPPYDGNANYVCKDDLTEPYEIFDPYDPEVRKRIYGDKA